MTPPPINLLLVRPHARRGDFLSHLGVVCAQSRGSCKFLSGIDVRKGLSGVATKQSEEQFRQTRAHALRRHSAACLTENFKAPRISPSAVHVLLINCN